MNFLSAYFEKHNVDVMPLQALFDFITDPTVNESNMDEYLDTKMQEINEDNDPERQVKEAVFKQAYIPQTLTQVLLIITDVMYNFYLRKCMKQLFELQA